MDNGSFDNYTGKGTSGNYTGKGSFDNYVTTRNLAEHCLIDSSVPCVLNPPCRLEYPSVGGVR